MPDDSYMATALDAVWPRSVTRPGMCPLAMALSVKPSTPRAKQALADRVDAVLLQVASDLRPRP